MENTESKTFQQSMNRLDEIVTRLGSSNLELEEAMSLFKEGLSLSKQCEKQLKSFEQEMNSLLDGSQNAQ